MDRAGPGFNKRNFQSDELSFRKRIGIYLVRTYTNCRDSNDRLD